MMSQPTLPVYGAELYSELSSNETCFITWPTFFHQVLQVKYNHQHRCGCYLWDSDPATRLQEVLHVSSTFGHGEFRLQDRDRNIRPDTSDL